MGVDADLTGILREIVQFLESLCEVDLPLKIDNARENLLQKSKNRLSTFQLSNRGSTSPEPYLDMNAGKGLLLFPKKINEKVVEIEEYVGVEEPQVVVETPSSHQDYYESFQDVGDPIAGENEKTFINTKTTILPVTKINSDEEAEDRLREIYKTFTPAVTVDKAHKSGPLYHKVERKRFGFRIGSRSCWIGLVGSHLLMYGSKEDKQPPDIYSLRGYMGRPASNVVSRDPERAKSAFEIFCPGNKTLQFIARTPDEMEEWLEAISRINNNSVQKKVSAVNENLAGDKIEADRKETTVQNDEQYQDVGVVVANTNVEETVIIRTNNESISENKIGSKGMKNNPKVSPMPSPPALPARIPRRLPSLPTEGVLPASYEPFDDGYEEDDIYHKIEDFREKGKSYQNVEKSGKQEKVKKTTRKEKKKKKKENEPIIETYDDVQNVEAEENKTNKSPVKNPEAKKKEYDVKLVKTEAVEMYDDVQAIGVDSNPKIPNSSPLTGKDLNKSLEEVANPNDNVFLTYDDIQATTNVSTDTIVSTKKENSKSKENDEGIPGSVSRSSSKSPQKRSFLDRVRHRKDSPKKQEEKKSPDAGDSKKKTEKKCKRRISLQSPVKIQTVDVEIPETDLPTYDDVSDYVADLNRQNASGELTMTVCRVDDPISNYNSPPPPRPIYTKPPTPAIAVANKGVKETVEEVYDDIANYRDDGTETIDIKQDKILVTDNKIATQTVVCNIDSGHYQTPRGNSIQVNRIVVDPPQEELYDDIAILADFRAKQRDSVCSSSSPSKSSSSSLFAGDKLTVSIKKSWNRFGSGKNKAKTQDLEVAHMAMTTTTTTRLEIDGISERSNDVANNEEHDAGTFNKLQKLINKVETTLGKTPSTTSTKSLASLLNKSNNSE